MKETRVKCHTCKGSGLVVVTGVYAETLAGLRRLAKSGYVVAGRDAAWFGCKATALNNRLAWLETHGLARSEKYGRERRFFAVVNGD